MSDDHTKNSRASRKSFEDNAEETALKLPARGASSKESATRGGIGAVPHHDNKFGATESPFETESELEVCRLRLEMQALEAAKMHLGAPEPYHVKATVTKETKETDMGIKFTMLENGIFVISDISKSSLFWDTALKVGYDLVSINGISFTGGLPEDCAYIILREVEGNVTIVAKVLPPTLVAATVVKESARNTKTGIKFCDSEDGKNVMISHISKTGLFKDTTLQVGYTVLSINNVFCAGMTRKEIKSMVQEAEGLITIVACHDRNMEFAGKVPFSGVGELEARRRLKARVHDKEAAKKCIGVIEEVVTEPSIPLRVTNCLPPQETPIVAEDEAEEEGDANEGVVECSQVEQASSLPFPSSQQGGRVSNHGAFAVQGQTVERGTNRYVSPMTEQGQMASQSASAGESGNDVTRASDDASSQVLIPAEVTPEGDLEVQLEQQLQLAICTAAVPAGTGTPMTGRKLWKRPAVLAVMAVFILVVIAVAVTSIVLSLGNDAPSDPPPTPPPPLSVVDMGIACESAVGPVPVDGSVTIGSNLNGTMPYSAASCGINVTAFGVWYKLIGTGSRLTASTCSNITDFDTQLAVFAGTCNNLVCIDSNNDACSLQSAVHWDSTDGETYFVFVSGHDRATGTFGLSLTSIVLSLINGAPECGKPNYNKATDSAMFLYRDCNTETWRVRATAGGQSLQYQGTLVTEQPLLSLTESSIEASDVLDIPDFLLNVSGKGQNGFNFILDGGACFTLDSPASVPLLAGSNRVPVAKSVYLPDFTECNDSPGPTTGPMLEFLFTSFLHNSANDTGELMLDGEILGSGATHKTDSGFLQRGLQLNGDDDYVEIPDHPRMDMSAYTLMAWVRSTQSEWDRQEIMEKAGSFWLNIRQDSNLVRAGGFYGACVDNSNFFRLDSDRPIPRDTWTHVAASYDGTELKIYINGELSAQENVPIPGPVCANTEPLSIGSKHQTIPPTQDEAYFKGLMDTVRVFDRELTRDEIRTQMFSN